VKPERNPKFKRVALGGISPSGDVENDLKTSLVLSDGPWSWDIAWNSKAFFLYPFRIPGKRSSDGAVPPHKTPKSSGLCREKAIQKGERRI
jgi:hypothetical protein